MHELLLVKITIVVVKRVMGDVRSLFGRFVYVIKTVWEELIMRIAHHTRFFTQNEASLVDRIDRIVHTAIRVVA